MTGSCMLKSWKIVYSRRYMGSWNISCHQKLYLVRLNLVEVFWKHWCPRPLIEYFTCYQRTLHRYSTQHRYVSQQKKLTEYCSIGCFRCRKRGTMLSSIISRTRSRGQMCRTRLEISNNEKKRRNVFHGQVNAFRIKTKDTFRDVILAYCCQSERVQSDSFIPIHSRCYIFKLIDPLIPWTIYHC